MSRHIDRHRNRRPRPEGESRRERRLQRIVGVGVVFGFLLLSLCVFQGYVNYQSQVNHHAASTKQQSTIIAQNKVIEGQDKIIKSDTSALVQFHAQTVTILNQIDALQAEFNKSVGMIPSVASALDAGQLSITLKLNDIDNRVDALCAALPSTVCPGGN